MEKTIELTYKGYQCGEDLFYCKENKRTYIRQDRNDDAVVAWLTSVKWTGGYEADCHIREGVTMRVVRKDGSVAFSETVGRNGLADKKAAFYNEEMKSIAKKFSSGLKSHKEWRYWLLSDADKSGFTGYEDNWLYWMSETKESRIITEVESLYGTVTITEYDMGHKKSDKKWMERLLIGPDGNTVEEICGRMLLE